jgi:hypothetical protein
MSIPAAGTVAPPPAAQTAPDAALVPRAAGGDDTTTGSGNATVIDADDIYRPAFTQATTPSAVQAVLTDIKLGG